MREFTKTTNNTYDLSVPQDVAQRMLADLLRGYREKLEKGDDCCSITMCRASKR
jgi:hypothetical protein